MTPNTIKLNNEIKDKQRQIDRLSYAVDVKSKVILNSYNFIAETHNLITREQAQSILNFVDKSQTKLHYKFILTYKNCQTIRFSFREEVELVTNDKDLVGLDLTEISRIEKTVYFDPNGTIQENIDSNIKGLLLDWDSFQSLFNI